ncbi:MAG: sugar phosphate isomerase/epimerase, partial [Oribacterium parvum]|nr:sugar phosphate isomerase/epimerase [Oribacterium parvum]
MKLGLLTAILDGWNFEEVIDEVSKQGLSCVEVACWPIEKSERRYGGVHHIDVEHLDKARAKEIKEYCSKRNVEISALGYYPNTLDPLRREQNIAHLKKVIVAAELLGV